MEDQAALPSINVLGTRVHMVQVADVLPLMEEWIARRGASRYIVASNMHAIIEAHKDAQFRRAINGAALFVPDGISTVWVGRQRGFPLETRVTGTDLMMAFCALSKEKEYRHFLYGDTDQVLDLASRNLRRRFPRIGIAGAYSPPFRPLSREEDDRIVALINERRPDVLWIGLGCPKQEQWMWEHRDRLDVPVVVGVGAAFKFVAGTVQRAPLWVQRYHIEWLWRLVREPRRIWRRVFVLGAQFTWLSYLETRRLRKKASDPSIPDDKSR